MSSLSVGIVGDSFMGWMGGAAFIGGIFEQLCQCAASANAGVSLFLDIRRLNAAHRPGSGSSLLATRASQIRPIGTVAVMLEYLHADREIIFYSALAPALRERGIHVVGLSGDDLGSHLGVPWCGYLPDFQHQYLPNLFSAEERASRDSRCRAIVENSAALFVNADAVARDVRRFFPGLVEHRCLARLPAVIPPVPRLAAVEVEAACSRHGVRPPFVISCSQRWAHKQHDLIVRAFARHRSLRPESRLGLVFTGDTTDYRNPDHADHVRNTIASSGVSDAIREVGVVPIRDQAGLIAGSSGLVQASLFEGGPGASGTIAAVQLGVPVLMSNIPVNRELLLGQRHYFEPSSVEQLAALFDAVADGRIRASLGPIAPESLRHIGEGACVAMIEQLRGIAHSQPPAGRAS